MNGECHILFGACTVSTLMLLDHVVEPQELVLGLACAYVGSTLPDLDLLDNQSANTLEALNKTVLHSIIPFALFAFHHFYELGCRLDSKGSILRHGCMVLLWLIMVYLTVASPHRGYSHSLAWCAVSAFCFWVAWPKQILIAWYVMGFLSHLAIDILNGTGERLLFPLTNRFCLKICKAGGTLEKIITSLCWMYYFGFLTRYTYIMYDWHFADAFIEVAKTKMNML